ncbi:MAG TPA: hypoxanthine phosphoribosyltransferase [Acidimicrobiia bacterium]|jgi:hypoxanthine phosphoribosyltransferase|nr:hypoxanthine phosphoribosyltransferase [Acidimicrobiia bacterium]
MSAPFVEVVPEDQLARRVAELGAEITADYSDRAPVLVGVLDGSVVFLADLIRQIGCDAELDFLALTRFGGDGRVSIAMDTSLSLEGRDVIVVEDIVDTGLTLAALHRLLELRDVASLATVTLLDKAPRRIADVRLEYRGFQIGDEFLLGYGLDWEGKYRNVRSLWAVMDLEMLAAKPEAFGEIAFSRASPLASGPVIG